MAKLNRINIAITGDSKGLVAATDAATKELRRLQAQADRTKQRLAGMRSTTMQTAEALGKFGLQSRGLGMAGGALGIAALGPAGAGLAAAGAATAGITMAISALANAVQQVPMERRAAVDALRAIDQDQRRSLSQFGFTRELAASAAARGAGPVSAAEGLGLGRGMSRGIAGTNTALSRLTQLAMNEYPGAAGVGLGTLAAGGGTALARQRSQAMLLEGRSPMENAQLFTDVMSITGSIRKFGGFLGSTPAGAAIQGAISVYQQASQALNLWSK